jgi:hypothetical protein
MHGLDVKYRHRNDKSLSHDLATQLYERAMHGKVAVVTDKPVSLLASTRKQWLQLLYKLQIERARTLQTRWSPEQSMQLVQAQSLTFTANAPTDTLEADITFATADDFVRFAPDCYTMFVACGLPKEKLYLITSWMPKGGLVVIYV